MCKDCEDRLEYMQRMFPKTKVKIHTTEGSILETANRIIGEVYKDRIEQFMNNDYSQGIENVPAKARSMLTDRFNDLDNDLRRLNDLVSMLEERLDSVLTPGRTDAQKNDSPTDPSKTRLEGQLSRYSYELVILGDRLHDLNLRIDL